MTLGEVLTPTPDRQRAALVALGGALAALLLAAVALTSEPFLPTSVGPGQDARAYWTAPLGTPYLNSTVGEESAYLYSPAFLHALAPLKPLPWPAFLTGWTLVLLAVLLALVGPVLFAPLLGLTLLELWGGNVHLLLAAAIVAGFRWPAAWAFVLLTKVTPGLGLLWFALRREWRSLAVALGATAAVAAVSWLIAPAAWAGWVEVLTGNVSQPISSGSIPLPLIVRLPAAGALIVWGARTDRRWTVPVAALLALPVIWYGSLTMLVALVALQRRRVESALLARLGPRADGQRGTRTGLRHGAAEG